MISPREAIRVLYVDDDVALVRLIQKALGRRGFAVTHAMNGEHALNAIWGDGDRVWAVGEHGTILVKRLDPR